MIEWVVSSSALISMLILFRQFFRKKLSMRVRYALWLAVALRLLIPVSFFESSLSVLNLLGQLTVSDVSGVPNVLNVSNVTNLSDASDRNSGLRLQNVDGVGLQELQNDEKDLGPASENGIEDLGLALQSSMGIGVLETQNDGEAADLKTADIGLQDSIGSAEGEVLLLPAETAGFLAGNGERMALFGWLRFVWMFGIVFFFGLVFMVNFRYWKCVYRSRKRYQGEGTSRLPVYVSTVVRMPCMFGLLHPAVYLSQEAMDEKALGYILCHENTHYRHKDNLWTLVRLFCVCIHWFNPLVWLAAYLSKQDCELACDEETIALLGNDNRIDYGRTLLSLSVRSGELFGGLRFSMTMSGSKKQLKERLQMIASQPKKNTGARLMVLLLIPLMFLIAFTEGKTAEAFGGNGLDVRGEILGADVYGIDVGSVGAGFPESDSGNSEEDGSAGLAAGADKSELVSSEDDYVPVDLNDGRNYTLQVISSSAANGYYEISQVNLCQADDDTGEVLQSICPGDVKPFYSEFLKNDESAEPNSGKGSLFRSEGEPLYAKSLRSFEELSAYTRGEFLADGSGTPLSYLPDGGIMVADLNFDGYDDFCLQIGVESVNRPFYCYLWNPEEERFVHSVMIPNVQVNQEMQMIESATEDGEGLHSVKYYRFDEADILHMVRYVEENQSPDAVFPFLDLTYQETSYALPAVDDWDAETEYGGALNERFIYWAKEALSELYEWSGTKIDTACFAVTWFGDFYFGQTPQDLDASRSFYDRVFGVRAGFSDVIESMTLTTERVVWYSPVVQWNVPEQLANMTDTQVVEWYFGRSGLTEGEKIETIENVWESNYVIRAESGRYYEMTLNRASREVYSVYGPYDAYPMH